jgi:hypothetical protein
LSYAIGRETVALPEMKREFSISQSTRAVPSDHRCPELRYLRGPI